MRTSARRFLLRFSCGLLLSFALLLGPYSSASFAEVLVLNDGQKIETQGPWQVEGRRVTYTALNGTFSALRLTLVDLEKSRAASEAQLNPPAEPAAESEPAREPGLVVRQGDLRTVAASSSTGDPEEVPAPQLANGEIGVSQWREEIAVQGTKLIGTLSNNTVSVYIGMGLEATLIAQNGDRLATRPAQLERTWADPGTQMSFEVTFPEVFAYTDVAFEVTGQPYERQPANDESNPEDTVDDSEAVAETQEDPPLVP